MNEFGKVCTHSQLERSCNICELEAERDRLKAEYQVLVNLSAELPKDRDFWRRECERLAEALRNLYGNDPEGVYAGPTALESLTAHEAAVRDRK